MRMSCNGCRVLRKGCRENCTIKPCLQWINSPDSQANATLFLAKFYGRAGLLNLINAGPQHFRPAIFKSLLYEACGRIVNPIYGSVGLMWSGNWAKCQAAVEAVFTGSPIIVGDATTLHSNPPLKALNIRHVSKEPTISGFSHDLHKVKIRAGFKRSVTRPKPHVGLVDSEFGTKSNMADSAQFCNYQLGQVYPDGLNSAWLSPQESESMLMVETVKAAKPETVLEFNSQMNDGEVGLELTLGLVPVHSY